MRNLLLLLGLAGSTTIAFGQASEKPTQIMQQGKNNIISMELKGSNSDTTANQTRIISQQGTNQIHIETTLSADSLQKAMESVSINQDGKGNTVSIKSEAGNGNSVQIRQSGSNNTVNIKQN